MRLPCLILALGFLAASPATAASFSCAKAETPDEKTICDTRALNDLDVEMAVRFDILKDLLPMGNRTKMQEDQEAWLKDRRACGTDVACLTAAYEGRLKILRGVLSEFAKQGGR
ncbi:lysozyme inhibitor LprI family protein [Methylorubrum populi]|uniref:Lysozyme inhibitor LprI-like N-terminal domain-containing protein n=1 Tax=Methylorubrum populi TaxID=223967 RepID=A0A921JEC9_9HYPH|nr:hypothetical protein [Methylorubrum populi]